jgi:hypothetical protein
MGIEEILPSKSWPLRLSMTNENYNVYPPMDFRMIILVPNETLKKFHPVIIQFT